MKALTISQPYASLIASGEKWVENRRWPTRYRGPLAIHAGKGKQYLDAEALAQYPTAAVLCVVDLVDCVLLENANIRIQEHEHAEGPYCWVLNNVRVYREPVPQRGAQGLWDWNEPDVVEWLT